MSKKESIEIQVLKNELSHSLKNPAENLPDGFMEGYRRAMNQAIRLVKMAQREVKNYEQDNSNGQ